MKRALVKLMQILWLFLVLIRDYFGYGGKQTLLMSMTWDIRMIILMWVFKIVPSCYECSVRNQHSWFTLKMWYDLGQYRFSQPLVNTICRSFRTSKIRILLSWQNSSPASWELKRRDPRFSCIRYSRECLNIIEMSTYQQDLAPFLTWGQNRDLNPTWSPSAQSFAYHMPHLRLQFSSDHHSCFSVPRFVFSILLRFWFVRSPFHAYSSTSQCLSTNHPSMGTPQSSHRSLKP